MVLRLAHVEIATADLPAARRFYVDLLGFVEHDASDAGTLYLRGAEEFDVWSLKISELGGGGLVHSGFRVASAADLDAIEDAQRALGLPSERVAAGTEPGQGEALRTRTPEGHRIEFFHELAEIDPYEDGRLRLPMRRPGALGGVPPARIDHVSMRVPDLDAALAYWSADALDFRASELWLGDDDLTPRVAWIRRATRSHDVALGAATAAAFHHVAYAVADAAALIRAADLLGDARLQRRIEWGPSRHGATNALALYALDPDGNRLELYTGDYVRDLDRPPLLWHPGDYAEQGHSWWGNPPPESFGATQPLVGDWVGGAAA
jgi:catechol 2,3-dioxygenase